MGDLTKNFSRNEFVCHCGCGFGGIDSNLVWHLQLLRNLLGDWLGSEHAIQVLSGCRCARHNRSIGGAPGSQHTRGRAADIRAVGLRSGRAVRPAQLAPLAAALTAFHGGGIGVYETFLHVDIRNRPARWGKTWENPPAPPVFTGS